MLPARYFLFLVSLVVLISAQPAFAGSSRAKGEAAMLSTRFQLGVTAIAEMTYSTRQKSLRGDPAGVSISRRGNISTSDVSFHSNATTGVDVCPAALAARGLADASGASACQFSYALAEAEPRESTKRKKPARPSPEQLAAAAADRAIALAPEPELRVAPARVGLTGLPSYFWLAREPEPITAQASAGGVVVTAEARPVEFVWDFGDGGEKVTSHSGRRWSPRRAGSIAHLYETKGRYGLTIDVIWEARWRVGGGSWQSLGYFSNSDARLYPVREVVAALVVPR